MLKSKSILLLLACLLLATLPALAQSTPELVSTPQPTPVATPNEVTQAPAEIETPVIEVESPDSWYIGIIAQLIDLIKWAVVAGGGYAITKAWRNPEQGKQYVSFGLGVFELVAKLTPTPKDDELFKGFREWWDGIAKETKEVAAQAAKEGVKELIDEERAKLAVNSISMMPPPTNPVS